MERSQREKKAVEKELDKVLAQKPLEMVQTGENLHELQKRVCVAERARDDAHVKLEALRAAKKRLESKYVTLCHMLVWDFLVHAAYWTQNKTTPNLVRSTAGFRDKSKKSLIS